MTSSDRDGVALLVEMSHPQCIIGDMTQHIHINGVTYQVAGKDPSDAEIKMREFADRMRHESDVYVDVHDPTTNERFTLVVNRDHVWAWGAYATPERRPMVAGF